LLVVPLALLGVVLGLAQLAQGPGSGLRFYRPTNPAVAVGLFANPNHFAVFLAAAMPLAAVATAWVARRRRLRRAAALGINLALYAVLLLGMVAAGSRAGLVLGLCAGVVGLAIVRSAPAQISRAPLWVVAAGGAVLLAIAAFGLLLALARTESSSDVFRLEMYRNTIAAAAEFFPLGSGFGTFEQVYRMSETPETVSRIYVNHAHNDWLELLLEGGLPAALLAGAAVAWLASVARRVWSKAPQDGADVDTMLPKAGFVIVAILLLHSLVDYPLRTTANSVLFAFGCALLVPPLRGSAVSFAGGHAHRPHRSGARRQGQ
jgi:O-antigen ligase